MSNPSRQIESLCHQAQAKPEKEALKLLRQLRDEGTLRGFGCGRQVIRHLMCHWHCIPLVSRGIAIQGSSHHVVERSLGAAVPSELSQSAHKTS